VSVSECGRCGVLSTHADYLAGRRHECFVGKMPQAGDVWQPRQEGVVLHVLAVQMRENSEDLRDLNDSVLLFDDGVPEKTYRMSLYRFWRFYKPLIVAGSVWALRGKLRGYGVGTADGLVVTGEGFGEIAAQSVSGFLQTFEFVAEKKES
jgi:hypothetical protein